MALSDRLTVTRTHFEALLTPITLRVMAIIQTALVVAPLLYVIPVIVMVSTRNTMPPGPNEFFLLNILSFMHGGALLTAAFGGTFLFQRIFSAERLAEGPDHEPEALAVVTLGSLRSAIILRLALFEGAAFFGITVCILAMMNGVLDAEPVYWLNLGSLLVFTAFAVQTFPTKERLTSWFEEMLARSR
jgi:hypothetical protein